MKLVIVESPSKAVTINKYLGKEYVVTSSVGHIRDLPKSNTTAIDIPGGFIPHYQIILGKEGVVQKLVSEAKKADEIILATDPDREGEAIAWHIADILIDKLGKSIESKIERVTFNAITKEAVTKAMEHPRVIDMNLKNAQEARRILDRLVGYDLSGLIWKKVRYGLSAGRVQSPALRILMERERLIGAFIPDSYFIIKARTMIDAKNTLDMLYMGDIIEEKEAKRIVEVSHSNPWTILDVIETVQERAPKPPFITSTLQQTASTRLGFSPSRTMRTAQKLYEAGHITYMRTDSPNLAPEAEESVIAYITNKFDASYVRRTTYASKSKNAQEAHEAIRPTHVEVMKCGSTDDEERLYDLIWRRAVASQMIPAQMLRTAITAGPKGTEIIFKANGMRTKSPGWLRIDPQSEGEETIMPQCSPATPIQLQSIEPEQKWTEAPNRYSEAGLIKELEKRGIGRPSTYASIIQTLVDRAYVIKEGRTLMPTDTGDVVSSFLEEHFAEYISDTFTADMEDKLDTIAEGATTTRAVLENFYTPFIHAVNEKEHIEKITNLGEGDPAFPCPLCGSSMIIKLGRGGKFLSCSRYPDCTGARTSTGAELGDSGAESLGIDPDTGKNVYVLEGRFGAYVQLGETPPKEVKEKKKKPRKKKGEEVVEEVKEADAPEKPRRASIPKNIDIPSLTLEQALHLLSLPRVLGKHPDTNEDIIANIGRFGPYIGHGREFRSLKRGDDPYTIQLARALQIFKEPKALPKGTELAKSFGKDPKTNKELVVLKSKSGLFVRMGLKRIYLPADTNLETMTREELQALMAVEKKTKK